MNRYINANFVVYAAECEFSEEDAAKVRWLISHIPHVDVVSCDEWEDQHIVICAHTMHGMEDRASA